MSTSPNKTAQLKMVAADEPTVTDSLLTRAMLVYVHIHIYPFRRVDKKIGKEVKDLKGVKEEKDPGKYTKFLLDTKNALYAEIGRIGTRTRNELYALTLRWDDNGGRILNAADGWDRFTEVVRQRTEEFDAAVERFMEAYPALKAEALADMSQMVSPSEYPSIDTLRGRFGVEVEVRPLPDCNDFRVRLGDKEVSGIKQQIIRQNQDAVTAAVNDMWGRLLEPVQKMADTLGDPEAGFHKSLTGNIEEVIEMLPLLNVTRDGRVGDVIKQIQCSLLQYSPQALKKSPMARQETAKAAAEMAQALNDLMF